MDKQQDRIDTFLTGLDDSFRMKTPQWLMECLREGTEPVIVDVRDEDAFRKSRITGSINIPLRDLPVLYKVMLPRRDALITCACNGSVQSAYAIMFLYTRGYEQVYNLSGGIGRWQKEGLPMSS